MTTKTTETPTTAPRPPDGTLTMQINNQTFILELFFNHNSKETFQDKLLRVILAEDIAKGVFIPVSNLPKKEPKIAERIA